MPSKYFPYEEEVSWEQWRNRYPDWCHGHEKWREQSFKNGVWNPPELPRPLELPQRVSSPSPSPLRPRVFLSHRQGDEIYAKRIAYLSDQAGFEYWLDVVNLPLPPVVATMPAIAVALLIEMALLNCSHIVAVYTDATPGSTWVPYEYGRVKEPVLSSTKCCAWLYINSASTMQPEWLELNHKCEHEPPLVQWLDSEFSVWCTKYPSCPTGSAGNWSGPTHSLP
jgi:hypothetical protein